MGKDLQIFQENNLFGAKNQTGEIIIPPQYIEMQPFSCGLSLVRNSNYQYAYINTTNKQVIPFGKYLWCDPQFTCGFARVMEYHYLKDEKKWGIIDTSGNVIVPLEYDKIWTIKEIYIFSIKAFIGKEEKILNLNKLAVNVIFDGLKYIHTYTIPEFKEIFNCASLFVKRDVETNLLYFTYGCNIGYVVINGIPISPVISIVTNSNGKVFPLLLEAKDVGKTYFQKSVYTSQNKTQKRQYSKKTSFGDYEEERQNDVDNWSDPYGDEQAYYDGWSREDVESGLADAYESDLDARWNND